MIAVGIEPQPAPVPPPNFPLEVAFMPVYMSVYSIIDNDTMNHCKARDDYTVLYMYL